MITETAPPHTCAISPSDGLQEILDKISHQHLLKAFSSGALDDSGDKGT